MTWTSKLPNALIGSFTTTNKQSCNKRRMHCFNSFTGHIKYKAIKSFVLSTILPIDTIDEKRLQRETGRIKRLEDSQQW